MEAQYLSPNRLSTKVHHAPGGHSSLSLAWDPPKQSVSGHSHPPRPQPQLQPLSSSFSDPPRQLQPEPMVRDNRSYPDEGRGKGGLFEENKLLEQEL